MMMAKDDADGAAAGKSEENDSSSADADSSPLEEEEESAEDVWWKSVEGEKWTNVLEKEDPRLSNVEQISLVAVLIAGFAVSDLGGFRATDFAPFWAVVYIALMANVVGLTMFIAVVGALTIVTVTREAEWDKNLAAWIGSTGARSYDEARRCLEATDTYRTAVRALRRLARFNGTSPTAARAQFGARLGPTDLGIPFSKRTLGVMTDFNTTPLGFARANFPKAILCYIVAVCIRVSQHLRGNYFLLVGPVCLVGWGLAIAYYSNSLLTILGHSYDIAVTDHLDDDDDQRLHHAAAASSSQEGGDSSSADEKLGRRRRRRRPPAAPPPTAMSSASMTSKFGDDADHHLEEV